MTSPITSFDAQILAQSELRPGESLVWSGTANARRAAIAAIPVAGVFGIPFAGPAPVWMIYGYLAGSAMPKSSQFATLFAGLPFLIIGLINLLQPAWVYRRELNRAYAVTNQRLMIISGGSKRSVRSLTSRHSHSPAVQSLDADILKVEYRERRDGFGDLIVYTYGSVWMKQSTATTRRIVRLFGVPNAKEVARQVSALCNGALRERNRFYLYWGS